MSRIAYTSEQADKLQVAIPDRRFVKPRQTAQQIKDKLELEKLQNEVKKKASPPTIKQVHLEGFKTIHIKPLSQNRAWLGKRFKSKDYKKYEPLVMSLLPAGSVPAGQLKITYIFGFSRTSCDIDNPVKICTDLLQKKYGFNDKDIFEMILRKVPVAKGNEFFSFSIESL